jgi:hypothetical protein
LVVKVDYIVRKYTLKMDNMNCLFIKLNNRRKQ